MTNDLLGFCTQLKLQARTMYLCNFNKMADGSEEISVREQNMPAIKLGSR
jgi:hypothetical protein